MNYAPPYDRMPEGPDSAADLIRVEQAPTAPPPKRPMVLEWFDAAAGGALAEPARPLIDRLLDETAFSVVYGASNAGKSFVALDMAFAVSTGRAFTGMSTLHGLVVYVAAEGGQRIRRRLAALNVQFLNPADAQPLFALIRYPIDLRTDNGDLNELIRVIRDAAEAASAPVVWVIVDTLSRAMAGGDENSPVDMGRIVAAADRIRADIGCHLTFVHHSGKDQARGARGHSLLRAATDTEIEVEPGKVTVTKQRDMEANWSAGFRLIDVDLGVDPNGQPIKSAVVDWLGDAPAPKRHSPPEPSIPRQHRLLIEVLQQAIEEAGVQFRPFTDGPLVRAVSERLAADRYRERIAERSEMSPKSDSVRKRVSRHLAAMLDAKTVLASERNGERFLWLP
jgi:hypothetical protein